MLRWTLLLLAGLSASVAFAQGCSDAGVCTMGPLRQEQGEAGDARHKISLSVAAGWGDDDVFVLTPAVQYSFVPVKGIEVQAKISANRASGRLGVASGWGDVLLDVVKTTQLSSSAKLSVVAGVKVPLSHSDMRKDSLSLPMQYQSLLGTYDGIIGASLSYKRWLFSMGYQQPLINVNTNMFASALWPGNTADVYPESNDFRRKADVIAKVSYSLVALKKWHITPGLLAIYHVSEDEYTNIDTKRTEAIKGSDGATLNVTLNIGRSVAKWTFGLLAGRPVIVRDLRPDGLTRSITLLPEISYKF